MELAKIIFSEFLSIHHHTEIEIKHLRCEQNQDFQF